MDSLSAASEYERRSQMAIEEDDDPGFIYLNRGFGIPISFIPDDTDFSKDLPADLEQVWDFFMTIDHPLQLPHVAEAVAFARQEIEDDLDAMMARFFENPDFSLMIYTEEQVLRVVIVKEMQPEINRLIKLFEAGVKTISIEDLRTFLWLDFTIDHACSWGVFDAPIYDRFSTAALNIFCDIIDAHLEVVGKLSEFDLRLLDLIKTAYPRYLNLNND